MTLAVGERRLGWLAGEEARDLPDVAALVAEFSGLLYRVAFSVMRRPAEAEDIVQETFVRVLEDTSRLKDVRELRPWLVRVAWNLALDKKRRVTPAQMDEVVAAGLVSKEQPADHVLAEARELVEVLAVVDRLPKVEREVLLLSAVEELSTAEIAMVLKRSESSVRSIAFRARTRLQERMGGRR
jgi:RNA polymerase sigma-70 factor, ECF subfamily